VDTSAIMAVLLNEPSRTRLRKQTEGAELVSAPTLPWEVGNGLSAPFKRKRLDLDQAEMALKSFREIPVRLGEIDPEVAVELAR
jgi:predicted nucleic acid-binding protein